MHKCIGEQNIYIIKCDNIKHNSYYFKNIGIYDIIYQDLSGNDIIGKRIHKKVIVLSGFKCSYYCASDKKIYREGMYNVIIKIRQLHFTSIRHYDSNK